MQSNDEIDDEDEQFHDVLLVQEDTSRRHLARQPCRLNEVATHHWVASSSCALILELQSKSQSKQQSKQHDRRQRPRQDQNGCDKTFGSV